VDPAIEHAAVAGLDNAAEEILTQGVSVVTVPVEVFSQALLRWRDVPRWRAALHALAAVAFTAGATESEIGFYAAGYLQYAKSR
jgi:inosine-uridine nucleoside N-ribohydrolase